MPQTIAQSTVWKTLRPPWSLIIIPCHVLYFCDCGTVVCLHQKCHRSLCFHVTQAIAPLAGRSYSTPLMGPRSFLELHYYPSGMIAVLCEVCCCPIPLSVMCGYIYLSTDENTRLSVGVTHHTHVVRYVPGFSHVNCWASGAKLAGWVNVGWALTCPKRKANCPGGGVSPAMLKALLCEKEVWYLSNKVLAAEAGRREGGAELDRGRMGQSRKDNSESQATGFSGREAGLS